MNALRAEGKGQFAVSLTGFQVVPPRGPVMVEAGGREALIS